MILRLFIALVRLMAMQMVYLGFLMCHEILIPHLPPHSHLPLAYSSHPSHNHLNHHHQHHMTNTRTTIIIIIIVKVIRCSQFIYSPPTQHTGQISFTPSNTNARHHLMTMRFQMPCPSHIHHLYSLAIPIELPTPPRPLTTTTFTQKTTEKQDKSTQTL